MDRVNDNIDQCALTHDPKTAVFTISQTKEIIRLDKLYNDLLRDEIQELRQRLKQALVKGDLDKIEESICVLKNLIDQGPKVSADVEELKKEIIRMKAEDRKDDAQMEELKKEIIRMKAEDRKDDAQMEELKKEIIRMKAEDRKDDAQMEKIANHVVCLEKEISEIKQFDSRVTSSIGILRDSISKVQSEVNILDSKMKKNDQEQEKRDQEQDRKIKHVEVCISGEIKKIETEVKRQLDCQDKQIAQISNQVMNQNRVILDLKEKNEKSEILNKAQTDKIMSMNAELNILEKKVERLETKDYRDSRIETIIARIEMLASKKDFSDIVERLICLEKKKYQDERVEKIIEILKTFESMRETVRENSKMKARIEALEEVNKVQGSMISELRNKNVEQDRQISCLNEKINKTALLLDGKLENVEKQVLEDEKYDLNQNTAIKLLQSQVEELRRDIHLLTAKAYTQSC